MTLPHGMASLNKRLGKCKRGAKDRGLEFTLTKEQFKAQCEMNCVYCEHEPDNNDLDHSRNLNGAWLHNGLDRIDSNKGYTIDNVQPCCFTCNRLKSDMTEEEVF